MTTKYEFVWLRTHPGSHTAHVFQDYIESDHGAFLSISSMCGERRDPAMKIRADFGKDRVCLRCSKIHNKALRQAAQRAEDLMRYAVPNNSEKLP